MGIKYLITRTNLLRRHLHAKDGSRNLQHTNVRKTKQNTHKKNAGSAVLLKRARDFDIIVDVCVSVFGTEPGKLAALPAPLPLLTSSLE